MSHGILNYYFKLKDELLGAVVRKANLHAKEDAIRLLRLSESPRERISAILVANFPVKLFARDIARAWVSYYTMIGQQPDFECLQFAADRRLCSNLTHALRQLAAGADARQIALSIALLIDGLWLRHATSKERMDAVSAIRHVEAFVDMRLSDTAV